MNIRHAQCFNVEINYETYEEFGGENYYYYAYYYYYYAVVKHLTKWIESN
jgi:hypothetical protein